MILVDIYTPAVDQTYDFMLDENSPVDAVMLEITEMLAKKTGSDLPPNSGAFILYNAGRAVPVQADRTLFENGVRDGDRLILV